MSRSIVSCLIVAPSGWHVRVFLTLRTYRGGAQQQERRADLATAGISLSYLPAFTPSDANARLVELARLGLAQGRKVVPTSQLNKMLQTKFDDPMYVIFAGHLLLPTISRSFVFYWLAAGTGLGAGELAGLKLHHYRRCESDTRRPPVDAANRAFLFCLQAVSV